MNRWTAALLVALLGLSPALTKAQNDWLDTLLPANHLLEKLPAVTVDGQDEAGGLFDFIDLNGDGKKDLLLAYRAQVSAENLDKPHDQTLAICFYDPKGGHYAKLFEEDGPAMKSIKVLTQSQGQRKILFVERTGDKGSVTTHGYAVLSGKILKLFELTTPPVFVNEVGNNGKVDIWISSKKVPATKAEAEKIFVWNDGQQAFVSKTGEVLGDKVLEPTFTPTAIATATPTPTLIPTKTVTPVPKKPTPVPPKPTPTAAQVAVAPKATAETGAPVVATTEASVEKPVEKPVAVAPTGGKTLKVSGWWGPEFELNSAFAKLKTEIVPTRVKENDIVKLGQQATAFFNQAQKMGVHGPDYSDLRAGYYTAVARAFKDSGKMAEAKNYLNMVLKGHPRFKEALDLKAEMKP